MSGKEQQSPSYDALLVIAQSVGAALARAGVTDCDDPGEAIDVMRENLEARVAFLESERRRLQEAAPQPPAEAQAQGDRLAIKLLVAAGHVTEAKANEALNIAHGFDKGPIAPPSAPVGVEWLCRVYSDAYHAGHHATVEGCYVDVLPVDRDTYWREKVQEDYPEALAQQPAAVDGAMVRDLLPDGWSQDCQGKQDYDADLVALSCRYYPPRYSENGAHSAFASIIYGDGVRDIVRAEFEASTEAAVKALVEAWAQQQVAALTAALAAQPGDDQE